MGWFDGTSDLNGGHSSSHRKHHRSRSRSPKRHSSGSIFGLGDGKHNASRSSFFGFSNRSSTSSYKRSPRRGYINRMYSKLRHLLHKLIYYLKKHPMKVFMLVIMPLITGGALTGLLKKFGIRLPGGLEKLFGAGGHGGGFGGGMGVGVGRDGGLQFERGGSGDGLAGGLGGLASVMGGAGSALSIAKMFM